MGTQLHQTFAEHHVQPAQLVWPSMVVTAAFALIHFVTWVYGIIMTSVETSGRGVLADTAYGQPVFVWGSIVSAVLLFGLVAYDVRRHDGPLWKYPRYAIGLALVALLSAMLSFLFRAATLL